MEEERAELTDEDRWKKLGFFKRLGRIVKPPQPKFMMPEYQRCPVCSAESPAKTRTLTGAKYRCRNHGEFVVVHPDFIRRV